jgi:hypothetical protein
VPTTPRGYDYPVQGDAPNVPIDIQALAESVDTDTGTIATSVTNQAARIQLIVLTADESRVSTTTLSNTALTLPVKANKQYKFEIYCPYQAATSGDLKYDITFPAGASMRHTPFGPAVAQLTNVTPPATERVGASPADGDGVNMGGNSNSATQTLMLLKGSLRTAGTAGSITLRIAQVTSSATASMIRSGSYIELIER